MQQKGHPIGMAFLRYCSQPSTNPSSPLSSRAKVAEATAAEGSAVAFPALNRAQAPGAPPRGLQRRVHVVGVNPRRVSVFPARVGSYKSIRSALNSTCGHISPRPRAAQRSSNRWHGWLFRRPWWRKDLALAARFRFRLRLGSLLHFFSALVFASHARKHDIVARM
jgi:hypothetical protein